MANKTITINPDSEQGNTNVIIQKAIDAVAEGGGGTVIVPAGTYRLQNAIHMRDHVTLVGDPNGGSIMIKEPSVSSPLDHVVGYGHYEFAVKEPEKFEVGMGIHLLDDNAGGFYTTVATIVDRDDDWFYINRPASHDYHAKSNGIAVSAFSLIEVDGVKNATVADLVLDGNPEEPFRLNGCRGGGVFAIGSSNLTFKNLEIRNYNGDALSFQQCADVRVVGCQIHSNAGHGLHPGSGSVRYEFMDNHVHDNGIDGLFYCLRTTHSICQGNRFENNARHGISIGERDTNHHIIGNTVIGNGGHGVDFRTVVRQSGDHVILENNDIGPNCANGETEHEINIPSGLRSIHMTGNRINVGRGSALCVAEDCKSISFVENIISDRPQSEDDVIDKSGVVSYTSPGELPTVGPMTLSVYGAKHLFVNELTPWNPNPRDLD